MRGKAALLLGAAAGYVLGARAGREQYDKIVAQAQGVWHDPKVQEKAAAAQDLAKEAAQKTVQTAKQKTGSNGAESTEPGATGATGATGPAR